MTKFLMFRNKPTEQLCELMLYIAKLSKGNPTFGSVKLNKLLYYADVEAYRRLSKTITGVDYRHLREGPVPPSDKARAKLIADRRAKVEYVHTPKKDQERLIALDEPKTDLFTDEQLSIVRTIVKKYEKMTGAQLSNESHKEYAYRLTKEGEKIPFRLTLISSAPPTIEQIEIGQAIAKKRGLAV